MTEKMIIEIKNSQPVELISYTNSLLCLADEYKTFLCQDQGPTSANESKLYIKQIKAGSIITELISQSPGMLPVITDINNIIAFSLYLNLFIKYMLTNEGTQEYSRKSLDNMASFLEPIAADKKASIHVATAINGNNNVVFNISSTEANAIQNQSRKMIEAMKQPITGVHRNVVLYWFQTRNDPKSQAGYQGIVESIGKTPVRVIMDAEIRQSILDLPGNIYNYAYLVDINVSTVNDKPMLYEILELHDKFPKE